MGRPAIFLDRDGVLNENRAGYVRAWEQFVFIPGTFAALRSLAALDAPIVVITNQAGVGRDLMPEERVVEIHKRMAEEIGRRGVRIERIFWCPHTSSDACSCRKPEPGMLLRAAEQLGINLDRSVFVGDAATDVEAGRRAGCKTVLVMTGRGSEAAEAIYRDSSRACAPDAIAADLRAAVPIVRQMLAPAPARREWLSRLQRLQPTVVADGLAPSAIQVLEG